MRSFLLATALFGIASCGGDGATDPPPPPPPPPPPAPVAPVAVGSIPAQAMTEGQSITVDVTPFFRDPDGGTLTYAAASSDESVVSVSLSGSNLTATAVAAGTATVTVTATDPEGLTATQSAEVTVEAANRAPEAVGTIPAQTATAGETATVDVAAFFSDPDGDELTYAAESSDTDVVATSMSGSSLTVTAVAAGTATVTVTATDPDSLSASQSAEVTVEESAGAGFRDDFDSAASLDDWNLLNAEAAIVDGVLRLTNTSDPLLSVAERAVDPVLTEWTVRASMGRAADAGAARLYWFTEDDRYQAFGVSLGSHGDSEDNYRFIYWDDDQSGWFSAVNLSGNSDAVRDAAGEFTDVTIGSDGDQIFLMAGDTELWRITPNAAFRAGLASVTRIWLAGAGSVGTVIQYDWFEVTGTEGSADMGRTGARGIDLPGAEISDVRRAPPGVLTRRSRDDR